MVNGMYIMTGYLYHERVDKIITYGHANGNGLYKIAFPSIAAV